MNFSILKLFPDNLIKALCDTLIHSLWQGLILAALTGLIVVLTRKSSPVRRYNLLIAAFALFAVATVCTFFMVLNKADAPSGAPVNGMAFNFQVAPAHHAGAIQQLSVTDRITSFFNNNANTIVLIWFLIVFVRCLQLATGLQGVYYLRRKNVFRVDRHWENRVQQLAHNLGINRAVRIVESGLAKVPMAIGHLKPLVLIPVGLLTAMPSEEIEAILIHELAHIRRSDYLVNLLQSLMEIVFFFNPAVLWISALIKTERENCCDDIAVTQSSSKVNYIKALLSCQEYDATSPAYAMALKSNKNHLKDRVTRIISNNNQSLNRMEKSLLAICLVTAALFTAAFTNAEKINKLVTNTAKAVIQPTAGSRKMAANARNGLKSTAIQSDTTTKGNLRIYKPDEIGEHTDVQIPNYSFISELYKKNGTLYQLNYRNKVLVSMQVNGKTIPSDQIMAYQPIINKSRKVNINDNAEPDDKNTQQRLTKLDSVTQKLKANNSRLNGSLGKLDAQNKLNEIKDQTTADSISQENKKASTGGAWTKPFTPNQPKYASANPQKTYQPAAGYLPKTPYYNKPYTKLSDDDRRDKMINELMADGIIQNKDNLSFKISTSEFIVNGKKQPEDIYQKYKEKYVKALGKGNGEWSWLYNYDVQAKQESNTVVEKSKN